MAYSVKEIFYTLQGEGANSGRAAVFCRFTGCNLWSGHERHRARAVCQFCDTDFVGVDGPGGGKFAIPQDLASAVAGAWSAAPESSARRFVVCTGGEPLLQLDSPLIEALHQEGFEIAVETNGTRSAPAGIDWLCVSPKAGSELVQRSGDEFKFIYPQPDVDPRAFEALSFRHFFLQPMDGPQLGRNAEAAIAFCRANPLWRLRVQTHKLLGFP